MSHGVIDFNFDDLDQMGNSTEVGGDVRPNGILGNPEWLLNEELTKTQHAAQDADCNVVLNFQPDITDKIWTAVHRSRPHFATVCSGS